MTVTQSPADLLPERFMVKVAVDPQSSCWLWTAGVASNGYGAFWDGRIMASAHRFGWQAIHGPVPPGLDLDHLCRVRRCVNPEHLEPVTRTENILRGEGPGATSRRLRGRTHCPKGHPYQDDVRRADGARTCLACVAERRSR